MVGNRIVASYVGSSAVGYPTKVPTKGLVQAIAKSKSLMGMEDGIEYFIIVFILGVSFYIKNNILC